MAGQIAEREIALRRGGSLRGRLLAQTGQGLVPAQIRPSLHKNPDPGEPLLFDERFYIATLPIDAGGCFEVSDLPPSDRYSLFLTPEGYPPKWIESISIRPAQTTELEHTLDLTDVTGVAGRVRRGGQIPEGGALQILAIPRSHPPASGTFCYTPLKNNGSFSCVGVRPGRYELTATADRGWDRGRYVTTLVVEAGRTTTLELDLPAEARQ